MAIWHTVPCDILYIPQYMMWYVCPDVLGIIGPNPTYSIQSGILMWCYTELEGGTVHLLLYRCCYLSCLFACLLNAVWQKQIKYVFHLTIGLLCLCDQLLPVCCISCYLWKSDILLTWYISTWRSDNPASRLVNTWCDRVLQSELHSWFLYLKR